MAVNEPRPCKGEAHGKDNKYCIMYAYNNYTILDS